MTTMKKKSSAKKGAPKAAAKPALKLGPIRLMLLEMRDDLIKTVRKQQLADSSQQDIGDAADQASQSIEKELLFELSDNERNTLDQIEAALRKLDKGTYGVCEQCHKPIAKPRLEALPFARYCITCQSTSEHAPDQAEGPDFRSIGDDTRAEA